MPKPNPPTKRLEQLDRNFQSNAGKASVRWIDAFDKRLAVHGLGWLRENRRDKHFRRLPDRAAASLSEAVQLLSHCPASVFLSFFTNSPDLSVRLTLADTAQRPHMAPTGAAGAELYFRDGHQWHAAATLKPSLSEKQTIQGLLEGAPKERREYRLYLPLYQRVENIAIGIPPGFKVEPSPAAQRPLFFYGTSITQGGCANTPGSDFVSLLGRRLDTEVINFGFSGNGKGEPEIARLIREVDAEAFVLDYLANVGPELLQSTLPEFVALLREKHPQTPIILIGNVPYNQTLWKADIYAQLERKREVLMEFYLERKRAGDADLHFIDGHGLLPIGESGVYVDGVHPTSYGFALMAERLAPQLSRILLWKRRSYSTTG